MNDPLQEILNVSAEKLNSLDMNYVYAYNFYHRPEYFFGEAGKEHYRLLTFISSLYYKKILFDVGTYRCLSAAALSSSMTNRIKTYDIKQHLMTNPILPGVQYCYGDATLDEELIKSPFIFFGVNHDGIFENKFYEHLKKIGWKGLLMLDDIYENKEMKDFWNSITEEKYDISDRGHWNGSGICLFK